MAVDMSEVNCVVCGQALTPQEKKINERRIGVGLKRAKYLCSNCRKREYNSYQESIEKLIKKE
ncbi:hypothetical protein HQ586_04615 [Candidatus Bathyarchaeota archaeon]|nr:hypothetical protein [Candidatus Bathyarchaeota archaeon]